MSKISKMTLEGTFTIFDLISKVRGYTITDEIGYLIDLQLGIMARRVFFTNIPPGYLLPKDVIIRVKNRENCLFYCPAGTDILLHMMPYYERKTWELLKLIMKKGDLFIDVGAHVGVYTIPIAHIVGPSGYVIAIEPSPIIKLLRKNIELNNLTNVAIVNKAAYSKTKILDFWYNPSRTGVSSLYKDWTTTASLDQKMKSTGKIRIKAEPLDKIVKETMSFIPKNIKMLKIDVERSELEVLRGAFHVLENTEYIIFEASDKTIKSCINILKKFNFKIRPIEGRIGKVGTANYIAFKHDNPLKDCNICDRNDRD
jgi:FkbM family methyltransferase